MTFQRAFILTSKHHGSNKQLKALATLVCSSGNVIDLDCQLRTRAKILMPLYRFLLGNIFSVPSKQDSALRKNLCRLILRGDTPTLNDGDLIIAKTPPFEIPQLLLSANTGAKRCFIGEPKRTSAKWFDWVISTPSTEAPSANVELSMMPSSFTRKAFRQSNDDHQHNANTWCLLVGGNTKGFKYTPEHWQQLSNALFQLSEKHGIRWKISTSPRTGKEAESILKNQLKNHSIIDQLYCWSDGKKNNVLQQFLLSCSAFFVTEDSAAMISDILTIEGPSVSIRPTGDSFNKLSSPLAVSHEKNKHILRRTFNQLNEPEIAHWIKDTFKPLEKCWSEEFIECIENIGHQEY